MTAGPDQNGRESRVPAGRERGFGVRHPDEPRFAGPPTAGIRPAPPPNPPTTYPPTQPPTQPPMEPPIAPPMERPPSAFDLEPVIDYGPGIHFPEPRDGLLLSRIGSGVAVAGGLMAALGSLFTWATLRLTAKGSDASGFTSEPSTIKYNGLSLLEGRLILVLGFVAIGLAAAAVPTRAPRALGFALAGVGGLGVVVMAFAAIGHPVELATLFRSYHQIDAVNVSLPNGVGTWLSLIGALLILAGGLLALMRGSTGSPGSPGQPAQREGRA